MTLDQTARDLVLVILDLRQQHAPTEVMVGAVRRVLAAEQRAEQVRIAGRLQEYKRQVQEDGAIWWPIRALDDFCDAVMEGRDE